MSIYLVFCFHQSNVRKEVKSDRVAWTSSHPEYLPNDFTAPSVLAAVYIEPTLQLSNVTSAIYSHLSLRFGQTQPLMNQVLGQNGTKLMERFDFKDVLEKDI